jgi:hypothetical protein
MMMAGWLLAIVATAAISLCRAEHRVIDNLPCEAKGSTGLCIINGDGLGGRAIQDEFLTHEEVSALHTIANAGMRTAPELSGPLILDIASGHMFGASGLRNIYAAPKSSQVTFADSQYQTYSSVVQRVLTVVASHFAGQPFLTAPTFLTRIIGSASWTPSSEHDEYYHYHSKLPQISETALGVLQVKALPGFSYS